MMKKLQRLLVTFVVCALYVVQAMAQGNNFGLGNSAEAEMTSLTNRVLNLEERNKAFQLYLNFRGGVSGMLDGDDKGGRFHAEHIRPEFLGELGKWSYRVRLNLSNEHRYNGTDGTNNIIDIARIFYNSDKNWSFSFGRSPLNYGTFEYEWNPVNVLQYYEFQGNQPDISGTSATIDYKLLDQLFAFEVANATTLPTLENAPKARERFPSTRLPFQYSLSWRGKLFDNHLSTIWSYTLRNETKNATTSLLMLGTCYNIGKLSVQLDYNGAFGKIDYLGLATADARIAGLIDRDEMATRTRYNQLVMDIGYWPTKRWNLFCKLGISNTSSADMEALHNYRTTYEYSAAAQYFLDKAQEVRLSMSYYGRTIKYKKGFALENLRTNKLELSLVCRLKIL